MLIFGIIALIRGRYLLFRTREVRGWPARIVGIFLIMPFPLSLLAGMVLGAVYLAMGKSVDDPDFLLAAQVGEFVIVFLCFVLAIIIAMHYSEPIRKKRSASEDVVIPDGYDERLKAGAWDNTKSQGITGGPIRPPTSPDDRIQS